MKKWIVLLENQKGQTAWYETADLTISRAEVGKGIFFDNKSWTVVNIIPNFIW